MSQDVGSNRATPVKAVAASMSQMSVQSAPVTSSKEFDPLSTQKSVEEKTQSQVMSSFGISSDGGFGLSWVSL